MARIYLSSCLVNFNIIPVILEDLKTINVQQANDRVVLGSVILLEKHKKNSVLGLKEQSWNKDSDSKFIAYKYIFLK